MLRIRASFGEVMGSSEVKRHLKAMVKEDKLNNLSTFSTELDLGAGLDCKKMIKTFYIETKLINGSVVEDVT